MELSVLEKNLTASIYLFFENGNDDAKVDLWGEGCKGYVPPPAPSPWDVLQLHGDTKSAVSFAMYSKKIHTMSLPSHNPASSAVN